MTQEPSWDFYRTFNAVMREGSLSGAAKVLQLTQPTVARHIDALETRLNVSLFLRTPRGLSPTDAALELAPHSELLASASATLLRTAEGRTGQVRGTIRISASEMVGVNHLPPILTGLRRQHPDLTIELMLSNFVDDLLQRRADIAIRMVRPTQSALVAKKVGAFTVGLHAHRDYLSRRGTPETLDHLTAHDTIGYDVETPAIRSVLQSYPMLSRSFFALRVDSDMAQLAAIEAGYGIGVCQTSIAAKNANLVRILPADFGFDFETWVVMHEDLRGSARCRAVFDDLVAKLTPLCS